VVLLKFQFILRFDVILCCLVSHHHHHHRRRRRRRRRHRRRHHRHHHHQADMELGHLLTYSGLTHLEVSLTVSSGFFCLLV